MNPSGPKRPTTSPSIPGFRLPHIDERFAGKHGAGYGGFPGPFSMIKRLFRMISPKLEKILLPRIKTYPTRLVPTGSIDPTDLRKIHAKEVPYFSFDAIVGKNSMFHDLTEEQLEELGGLEYKALRLLLKIIPAVGPEDECLSATLRFPPSEVLYWISGCGMGHFCS